MRRPYPYPNRLKAVLGKFLSDKILLYPNRLKAVLGKTGGCSWDETRKLETFTEAASLGT